MREVSWSCIVMEILDMKIVLTSGKLNIGNTSLKFYGDSVTNESARAKKLQGGGRQTPPQPL